jgi:hypothetical protein
MMEKREPRLYDLEPHDTIRVYCTCGRCVEFANGCLQRWYRMPSHMLVMDLQYRMRCTNCRAIRGFKITLYDERERGNAIIKNERVIVEGGS